VASGAVFVSRNFPRGFTLKVPFIPSPNWEQSGRAGSAISRQPKMKVRVGMEPMWFQAAEKK
jgi:hypothetical protein